MRKPVTLSNQWSSIHALVGSGIRAWVYGSVANGSERDDSDIDIYVSGPCAEALERKYFIERPLVQYNGCTYPAHIVGPAMVSESDFLKAQPGAIRVV